MIPTTINPPILMIPTTIIHTILMIPTTDDSHDNDSRKSSRQHLGEEGGGARGFMILNAEKQ